MKNISAYFKPNPSPKNRHDQIFQSGTYPLFGKNLPADIWTDVIGSIPDVQRCLPGSDDLQCKRHLQNAADIPQQYSSSKG